MFDQVLPGREKELSEKMFMSKSEVVALCKAGMTIVSHGVNHYDMRTISQEDRRKELSGSKKYLEELLNSTVSIFAFTGPPVGGKEIAEEVGYLAAFEYKPSEQVNQVPIDMFAMKRMHERDLDKEFLT
jgi:peptidoglycan/xylan/chitin deacetylase (PgdA/CDA1 family)